MDCVVPTVTSFVNCVTLECDVRARWMSAADILSFCQIGPQVGADIEIGFGDFVVDIGGTAAAPNHLQETFEFFQIAGSKILPLKMYGEKGKN